MNIKKIIVFLICGFISLGTAYAAEDHQHGSETYHAFILETAIGHDTDGKDSRLWDLDGWVGTDENKLWLKSEGERVNGDFETAEFWALYSRNIAMFWDAQIGVRYDNQPNSMAYGVIGFNGLARYFFETETHLFLSEEGEVTARLRQENDFLITQKLITQPFIEVNFSAQKSSAQEIGAGLTDTEIGLLTRYEFTRAFAPYVELKYEQKWGGTAKMTQANGEKSSAMIGLVGLRLFF